MYQYTDGLVKSYLVKINIFLFVMLDSKVCSMCKFNRNMFSFIFLSQFSLKLFVNISTCLTSHMYSSTNFLCRMSVTDIMYCKEDLHISKILSNKIFQSYTVYHNYVRNLINRNVINFK